jgi:RND family efflux transporter MFP subunit
MAAVLIVLAAGCRPAAPAANPAAKEPVAVRTGVAESRPLDRTITVLGTLLPMDEAPVSIKVTGRLNVLSVDVGSEVMAGAILGQVEPRDYELRVRQSAALLAQARVRLGLPLEGDEDTVNPESLNTVREAKALFEEAEKGVERVRKLQAQNIISEAELERATAEHQVTLNRYQDALQDVRERQSLLAQRRAEYEIARQQVSDTSLRAPFSGVVQERLVNVGQFLSAGTPVLTLVRINPLRLRLEIPERQAALIRSNQPVRVSFEAFTNRHSARIVRVSPALNERTRSLVVEAEMANPGNLRAGSFARSEVVVETAAPTLMVPADALVTFAGTEKVFLVVTNRALERPITSGRRMDGWIEVLKGLKPGEVVIRQPGGLQTGEPVRPAADTGTVGATNTVNAR